MRLLGRLYVWGKNDNGCLGVGNARMRFVPEQNKLLTERLVTLDVHNRTAIAVDVMGVVYTWGEQSEQEVVTNAIQRQTIVYNTVHIPTRVHLLDLVRINNVACGNGFFMAVSIDGCHVFIWGKNVIYKPFNSNHKNKIFRISGMRLGNERRIKKVVCGDKHSIMLLSNGEVWGLGDLYDGYDEFDSDSDDSDATILCSYLNYKPVHLLMNHNIVDIECGTKHTLYLEENGNVYISGYYTKKNQEFIYLLEKNVDIIKCGFHSCLLLMKDGSVKMMGENTDGELSCWPEHKPTIRSPKCVNFPQ